MEREPTEQRVNHDLSLYTHRRGCHSIGLSVQNANKLVIRCCEALQPYSQTDRLRVSLVLLPVPGMFKWSASSEITGHWDRGRRRASCLLFPSTQSQDSSPTPQKVSIGSGWSDCLSVSPHQVSERATETSIDSSANQTNSPTTTIDPPASTQQQKSVVRFGVKWILSCVLLCVFVPSSVSYGGNSVYHLHSDSGGRGGDPEQSSK